jgi:hypothetical protein
VNKFKSGTGVVSISVLYVCQLCGWVGPYDALNLGMPGTKGYAEDPKCPRCRSTDLRNDYQSKGGS